MLKKHKPINYAVFISLILAPLMSAVDGVPVESVGAIIPGVGVAKTVAVVICMCEL